MADLFDRISRTASSVGEKGKTWLELARLRGELERTQDDRTEAVRGLGEKVYQQIRAGGSSSTIACRQLPTFKNSTCERVNSVSRSQPSRVRARTRGVAPRAARSMPQAMRFV